jgi:NAD(P)-dependent dehydrogenase (short-subunit alcohol dehydrogenase family)
MTVPEQSPPRIADGKTVLITGAGGGLGRGFALALADAGANVVVSARRVSTAHETVELAERRGGEALAVECDVTSLDAMHAAVAAAIDRYGRLDAVVHNALAPAGAPTTVEALPDETWSGMVATAIDGSYNSALASHAALVAARGSFVVVTSRVALYGNPQQPAYAMAKGAQRGFVKALAREWGPSGVRVNGLAPVAMSEAMERTMAVDPALRERVLGRSSLRRIGDATEDIGPVLAFLVSDASAYVTGQTFVADGGGYLL